MPGAPTWPLFLSLALVASACGGNEHAAPVVVPKQSAEEAILQISPSYATTGEVRRLLDPPSELAIHLRRVESRLTLTPPQRTERVRVFERYEYRDGRAMECQAEAVRPVQTTFRFLTGEPAVRLVAKETPLSFRCQGGTPAELIPDLSASAVELVLRDESLVVVSPPADRRRYLPTD